MSSTTKPAPKVTKTKTCALRESIIDEKKRQQKVAQEEKDNKMGSSASAKNTRRNNESHKAQKVDRNSKANVSTDEVSTDKEMKTKDKDSKSDDIGLCRCERAKSQGPTKVSVDSKRDKPKITAGSAVVNVAGKAVPQARRTRSHRDNLEFYQNKTHSKPLPGNTIEEMLKWRRNYAVLERNHHYIQWLFPIPEGSGMNPSAQPLMDDEAEEMRNDDKVQERVLKAYKMMLDFYGMRLVDTVEGRIGKSDNYKERFEHLNRSRHNLMRITRILKSLGELGYERFQARWVDFLMTEATVTHALHALSGSCMLHWIAAVKDPIEQEALYKRFHGFPVPSVETRESIASEPEDEEDSEESGASVKAFQNDLMKDKNSDDKACDKKGSKMIIGFADEEDDEYDKGCNREFVDKVVPVEPDSEEDSKQNDKSKAVKEIPEKMVESVDLSKPSISSKTSDPAKMPPECINDKHGRTARDDRLDNDLEKNLCKNLLFYQDRLLSTPSPGYSITTMLKHKGNHQFFDKYPGFLQWLFPTQVQSSFNRESQPLQEHETKAIREDAELNKRFVEAYRTALDYFGMELKDDICGKVEFTRKTSKSRWQDMQGASGFFARALTRILTSLGELGYERFQVPLIDFLIVQVVDNDLCPSLGGEDIMHWLNAVTDGEEKKAMFKKYQTLAGRQPQNLPEVQLQNDFANLTLSHGSKSVYDPTKYASHSEQTHKKHEIKEEMFPAVDMQTNLDIKMIPEPQHADDYFSENLDFV